MARDRKLDKKWPRIVFGVGLIYIDTVSYICSSLLTRRGGVSLIRQYDTRHETRDSTV
jgi:hypothetical protein